MIFGECDNSSLTHVGKHKNVILDGATKARYFRPCYISHFTYSHRPIILRFHELK